jgi:hypothetical protein
VHKVNIQEQKTNGVRHWVLTDRKTGKIIGDFSSWYMINEKMEQHGDSRRIVKGRFQEITVSKDKEDAAA